LEETARYQLLRQADRRNAILVKEIRATALELNNACAAAILHLHHEPTGNAKFDGLRDNAAQFAAERARSFTLLLSMLDSPAIADEKAWNDWLRAARSADALWQQITKP
jgi:hypothetical protein